MIMTNNLGWSVAVILGAVSVGEFFYIQTLNTEHNAQIEMIENRSNAAIQAQTNEANAAIQAANAKLKEAAKREVPVSVRFRAALIGSGYIAVISNNSGRSIAIKIKISRSSVERKTYETVLDGGASKEIGEDEGWAFVSGDAISIEQDGHKSLTFTMN
jgi:hypothetical protein